MAVIISPSGLSATALTANQVSILATYKERLCNAYCINSSNQPQYAITYSYGTPTLNGTSVFVPITASITIVTPTNRCSARTQLFTETFDAVFQGQTTLPTSVTIASVGRTGGGSDVRCCMAQSYSINDSLTITLTT